VGSLLYDLWKQNVLLLPKLFPAPDRLIVTVTVTECFPDANAGPIRADRFPLLRTLVIRSWSGLNESLVDANAQGKPQSWPGARRCRRRPQRRRRCCPIPASRRPWRQ
jgi:hypothetical protein